MKTSNSLIDNMASVRAAATRLDCTVVAVVGNYILCHRSDNTFITWQASIYGGFSAERAEFISGCYDMTADAAQANLIERAFTSEANSGYYLVKLTLVMGSVEKSARHIIKADTEQDAGKQALINESHDIDAGYQDDGEWWDLDEYIYKVDSAEQLTHVQYDVLRGI